MQLHDDERRAGWPNDTSSSALERRLGARTNTAAIRLLTGDRELVIDIVTCIQAHGSLANWHPHLHLNLIDTDRGSRPDGTFVTWPAHVRCMLRKWSGQLTLAPAQATLNVRDYRRR
ncbi:MAG TPA: hypothetical protein VIK50_05885 [Gemmatimonadaceae bacterium]